jgi:hypothetical protein
MVFGLLVIAVGVIALLVKTDVISGSIWSYFWPTALIIIGLSFLFGRMFRFRRWRWFGCCMPWDDRDKSTKE